MNQVCHPGSAAEAPQVVVVIKLKEGPRLASSLLGTKPHEIRCGMSVPVVCVKISEQVTLPKFQPRSVRYAKAPRN